MGLLPVEPLRLKQCAVVCRALLEPAGETVLVDEMDQPRPLAAVGNEERCEVGHALGSKVASPRSQSASLTG